MAFESLNVLRPANGLMSALAVLIGAGISNLRFVFNDTIGLGMVAAFLICSAGQIINDYFDFEIDKTKNKPKLNNKNHYLIYAFFLFAFGNIAAFFVNQTAFQIAIGISILLIAYSAALSKFKFIGNIVIALGTALPLVFGATIFGRYQTILWLAASAFFANWAREIVKDVQDESTDEGKKVSLPMLVRASALDWILGVLVALAILSAFAPVALEQFGNFWFLVLIAMASGWFVKALHDFHNLKTAQSAESFKYAMILALVGFLVGTFQ